MERYQNITKVTVGILIVAAILLFSLFATEGIFRPDVASATYDLSFPMEQPLTYVPGTGEIYILFEDLEGEVIEAGHKGWCEIISFEQGHIFDTSDGGLKRPGNVVFEDIKIVKVLDKTSPKLAEAVCEGRVFPKVEIDFTTTFTDAGNVTYFEYQLGSARVTSYSFHGSGDQDDRPTEELTVSFGQIKATYTEFDAMGKSKGKVEYSWKVEEGGSLY